MDQLSGSLFFIGLFAYLAFTEWSESRKRADRDLTALEARKLRFEEKKMQFEGGKLLLEKCQSSEEVSQFLATDAGRQFLERLKGNGAAPPVSVNPLGGIMALTVFGAVCLCLGIAFYLSSRFTSHSNLVIPAFLLSVPGLGLLIGAAVSYHLKKKWGLLQRDPPASAG